MIARTGILASSRTQSTPIPSVTIGTQIWSLYNLDVDKYRNGDPIPQVTGLTQWANLTTGAWCYYNNDPANGPIYGKLYNWYAVNDPRGLAPIGWHIPTDAEWTILTNFLGGLSVAGGKMKSTTGWNSPNTGATNSSGFTGLPGGQRTDSLFNAIGIASYFWSSTESGVTGAYYRDLYYSAPNVIRSILAKFTGASVRLIKD